MKNYLLDLYAVAFNHFLKMKEGKPNLMGYLTVFIFSFVFVFNIIIISLIFTGKDLLFYNNKFNNFVGVGIIACLGYFVFYKIFKIKKHGVKVDISNRRKKVVWIIFILNFLLFFILAVIRKKIHL
ncbi:hypothetical protein DU508_14610 [Pedobacter chinensis]|uniref:Uncharacterized protein n=1 Tax=Pedobacter chinensis TaxID=2282421 RepID=A0A369PXS7_9SPHI|nr:hypothetical protein DU508_14610 [Pedobacter chinensis]